MILRILLILVAAGGVLSALGRVAMVGQPREPVTPKQAVVDVLMNGTAAVVLVIVAVHWEPS